MSIPAFAWALEQGRVRNLPTSARMLLVVIADRGNGRRACSAGQECLANDTGLKERQVRISTQLLEAEGLIRIEKVGKSRLYHVLRPANGEDQTPAHTAGNTPAHTAAIPAQNAGVQRTTPARKSPTPAFCAETPAHTAAKPYSNQENQETHAQAHARQGEVLTLGEEGKEARPPSPDTTEGGDPVDQPVDPARVAAVLATLRHELRMRAYPPRAATMDREDQIAATLGPRRDKPHYLAAEQLAAARRIAGIGVMA